MNQSSSALQDLNHVLSKSKIISNTIPPEPIVTTGDDSRTKKSATVSSIDSLNIHSIESIKFNSSATFQMHGLEPPKISEEQFKLSSFQEPSQMTEDEHDGLQYNFNRIRSATTSAEIHEPIHYSRNNSNISINPESPTWILSDLLSGLSSVKDKDEYSIVSKGNELVLLLQTYPELKSDIILKNFINKIQFMFYHQVTEVRSMGYRLLRHVISSYESLMGLIQSKILIYIIITMSTTRSSLLEKEQALKLIRGFLRVEKGSDNLSIGVIKSMISLIESGNEPSDAPQQRDEVHSRREKNIHQHSHNSQPDGEIVPETFKNLCIETICEIALVKPELVFHAGGFKVIVNTIMDGSLEMSLCCLLIIPKILDFQNSRKFLRNGFDLISLMTVFTDSFGEGDTHEYIPTLKLQKISFLLTILLKNFNGLLAFSINDFEMLKDLISSLKKKNEKIREYIMDIICDVLLIKPLPWLSTSPIGELMSKYTRGSETVSSMFAYPTKLNEFEKNITNHYQGLFTLILIKKINIFDLLTNIIEQGSNNHQATQLLTSIYSLANNLLPAELILKDNLITPKISCFVIDQASRNKFKPSPTYNKNLRINIKNMNMKARYNIEDVEFKAMIANTRVLTVKEFEDWNWGLLLNLIQGPFSNPKRFDELLEKNPKFLKRILSFYRPFKFRFCNISLHSKNASKYINIGCQLLEMFLGLESGVKYLLNNKLLPQLSEIFAQIDPYSGVETKDPILAKKRLENTVSIGYLKFIGVLSSNNSGLKILERWQFFLIFNNIIDGSIESDLNNLLIISLFKNVDFSVDSQFRVILLKSLKISNLEMKLYFVNDLLPSLIKTKELEMFVLKVLVLNLYDSEKSIVNSSINLCEEYFETNNFKNLDYFIDLNPSICILEKYKAGKNLLFNFLSIPHGFKYLDDAGFIDSEFQNWLGLEKDFSYLNRVERIIHGCFFPYETLAECAESGPNGKTVTARGAVTFTRGGYREGDGSIVFFRNLLSTEEGLLYFTKQRNYVDDLINEIEDISHQLSSKEAFTDIDAQDESHFLLINTLKQDLWIIGIISLGKFGIQLLEPGYSSEKSIISIVIELFRTCSIWQIRGLCFYVIGMISSTIEGIEILDESDWISVLDQYSNSKSLTYPKLDLSVIFDILVVNPYQDSKYFSIYGRDRNGSDGYYGIDVLNGNGFLNVSEITDGTDAAYQFNDVNNMVYESIVNVIHSMNSILKKIERRAYKELIRIKKLNPEAFNNLKLFLDIIKLIDKGNFKFHKRKFIFDLFLDSKVLEMLLKKERKYSMRN